MEVGTFDNVFWFLVSPRYSSLPLTHISNKSNYLIQCWWNLNRRVSPNDPRSQRSSWCGFPRKWRGWWSIESKWDKLVYLVGQALWTFDSPGCGLCWRRWKSFLRRRDSNAITTLLGLSTLRTCLTLWHFNSCHACYAISSPSDYDQPGVWPRNS